MKFIIEPINDSDCLTWVITDDGLIPTIRHGWSGA